MHCARSSVTSYLFKSILRFPHRDSFTPSLLGRRVEDPSYQDGKERAVIHYKEKWATLRTAVLRLALPRASRTFPVLPVHQCISTLSALQQPPRQRTRPSTSSGIPSPTSEDVPLFTPGDRSSIVALMPLSPPPARRSTSRRTLDHTVSTPILRPMVSRRPSFLDMRDDLDREQPPPDDSFLDMDKVSLDTVRSSMEVERAPS